MEAQEAPRVGLEGGLDPGLGLDAPHVDRRLIREEAPPQALIGVEPVGYGRKPLNHPRNATWPLFTRGSRALDARIKPLQR
ncbi:MAG: hypothetical protein QW587_09290 [Candidatus Bathyarchaeia archaeon]